MLRPNAPTVQEKARVAGARNPGLCGGAENRTSPENPEDLALFGTRGAKSGALAADLELSRTLAAWPTLPDPIKVAILALVHSVEA